MNNHIFSANILTGARVIYNVTDMKRDLYNDLLAWKSSGRRKPLLLRGARQTGKTYLLKAFGRDAYNRVVYFNFEEDPALDALFVRNLRPKRILNELSLYAGMEIRPESDLVIFDEIQASDRALNALKYFQEEAPDYHVAAAGSLPGVKLSDAGPFPLGKVNFLDLYPLTFPEFLEAVGAKRYRKLLAGMDHFTPLAEIFHNDLIDLLRQYYFVGGMPEAVSHYADTKNHQDVRKIQQGIINAHLLDFAKHAPPTDIPKLTQIWDSIPKHLARKNKKFNFSAVKSGARAREYEQALSWLEDAGLIYRVTMVDNSRYPLKHYADRRIFKVYALDVGLLGAMAGTPMEILAHGTRIFNEYEGAFVENYTAQQLVAAEYRDLYYWRSKGGTAELDFLYETAEHIIPLEVKADINPKSKSLQSYDDQFDPPWLVRSTLLGFKQAGKIRNTPLYAVSMLSNLLK